MELGGLSVRRDRWQLRPGKADDPGAWLNNFNQQWVDAARRISPVLQIARALSNVKAVLG